MISIAYCVDTYPSYGRYDRPFMIKLYQVKFKFRFIFRLIKLNFAYTQDFGTKSTIVTLVLGEKLHFVPFVKK